MGGQRPTCVAAPAMLPPREAWQVLAHIQHVVWTRPDVAYAVRHLTRLDQLVDGRASRRSRSRPERVERRSIGHSRK